MAMFAFEYALEIEDASAGLRQRKFKRQRNSAFVDEPLARRRRCSMPTKGL